MSFNSYVGWDIGGAHLKVASIDNNGCVNYVNQLATPLWKDFNSLEDAILKIRDQMTQETVRHAITMTAELADIFKDRDTGVKALSRFLAGQFADETYYLYAGDNGLIEASKVSSYITDIASANWHATASFVMQYIDNGVLIDIGSTTTDMIPFTAKHLANIANTDHERLRNNELVYSGIIRTSVMAVVNKIYCDGQWQNIVAENFSTMADVYRLLHQLNEQDDMMNTADGAGKTNSDSARRLMRMVGLDLQDENNISPAREIAEQVAHTQLEKINESLLKILSRDELNKIDCLIGAGAGRFLVRQLAAMNQLQYIDFTALLEYSEEAEQKILSCAAAVSVAQLARGAS